MSMDFTNTNITGNIFIVCKIYIWVILETKIKYDNNYNDKCPTKFKLYIEFSSSHKINLQLGTNKFVEVTSLEHKTRNILGFININDIFISPSQNDHFWKWYELLSFVIDINIKSY